MKNKITNTLAFDLFLEALPLLAIIIVASLLAALGGI
jgi:hypothetical protein